MVDHVLGRDDESDEQAEMPDLTAAGNEQILGAPEGQDKKKSNVSRFVTLLLLIMALVFILGGWFLYSSSAEEKKKQETAIKQVGAFQQSNDEVDNKSIQAKKDKLKEKLKREEEARLAEEAEAERLAKEAEAEAERLRLAAQQNQPTQGTAYPDAPKPLSAWEQAFERKKEGAVLLDYSAAGSASKSPLTTSGENQTPSLQNAAFDNSSVNKTKLTDALTPTVLDARFATKLMNLDYLLKRGTTIPCALRKGIDTTLAGFTECKVLRDVYSANDKTLLIERGATMFGEQTSALRQGQARVFVLWTRIDNPSGITANLDSPAIDQMGYNGLDGYIDTHFWERFGGAIMVSLIKDFSTVVANRTQKTGTNNVSLGNTSNASEDLAVETLRNSINIPPTLVKLPGSVVYVDLQRDISFETVYKLVEEK